MARPEPTAPAARPGMRRATIAPLVEALNSMEINQIRRSLEDLAERSEALRRFL
jgi:hypothetical protein